MTETTLPRVADERHTVGFDLAKAIKEICDLTDTRLSRFGRDAVGGPRFYFDLVSHHNRQPRLTTRIRALSHIQKLALEHSRREKEGNANGAL
jgi:hypothetical protein